MTPLAEEHLDRAREYVLKATRFLEEYNDEAGRAAYLAGFHAAQALIAERRGEAAKTHRGVRSLFQQLTAGDERVDPTLRRFLARAYVLKETADYATGARATVSWARAERALETARRFVDCIVALLKEKEE